MRNIPLSLYHLLQSREKLSVAFVFLALTCVSAIPFGVELILELFVSSPHVQSGEDIAFFLGRWLIEVEVVEVLEGNWRGGLCLFGDDEGVIDENGGFILIDEDCLIVLVIKIRAGFCALLDVLAQRDASVED